MSSQEIPSQKQDPSVPHSSEERFSEERDGRPPTASPSTETSRDSFHHQEERHDPVPLGERGRGAPSIPDAEWESPSGSIPGESPPIDPPSPQGASAWARRLEALRREAAMLSGGTMLWGKTAHFPPEIEEAFWQQIIEFESVEPVLPFDLLLRGGVTLPPPALLREFQLPDKLWEVIYFLASIGCYLENTDHLSDRELYTDLWDNLLRQPAILLPDDPGYAFHLDLIGSGSAHDQQIYLQYYACEETRRRWIETWPDQSLPPRRPRPWDRDRHLPRAFLRRHDPSP